MDVRRATFWVVFAAALFSIAGGASGREGVERSSAGFQQSFPDGPGKNVFVSVCSLCHIPEIVTNRQWTEKQWDAKVTEMLQEEQDVTAEERAAIVAYLSANFKPRPKVAVNRATAAELATSLGLTEKEADAIVRHRQEKGPFKNVDDLKRVSGVDPAKLDAARDRLEF